MDVLRSDFPDVVSEIREWMVEFDKSVGSSNTEDLARFHAYDSEKFIRIEPNLSRMDRTTGREREEEYFSAMDRVEHTTSDTRIDVIGPQQAVVTARYQVQGFQDGSPAHEPFDLWLTMVLVKDIRDAFWKIVYESLVSADETIQARR